MLSAYTSSRNNKGHTPRHEVAACEDENKDQRLWVLHSVGAERCPPGTDGCKDGCVAGGTYDGISPSPPTLAMPSLAGRELLDKLVDAAVINASGNYY
jgi:calcium-independent phospholipase A2